MDWQCCGKSTAYVLRLESLVCILDVESYQQAPSTTGFFKVKLTKDSAAALHKLDELELWTVGHTMQRGQQKVLGGDPEQQPDFSGKKDAGAKAKITKRKRKEEDPTLHADDIRRSNAGRAVIQKIIKDLRLRDDAEFPSCPMFDMNECCRLKLPGAEKYTWGMMLEIVPEVMECMRLGWVWCVFEPFEFEGMVILCRFH